MTNRIPTNSIRTNRARTNRRWWPMLAGVFVACLALIAVQAQRPLEQFAQDTTVLGSGPEVIHAGIAYRITVFEYAEEFATDYDPRRAIPGSILLKVVVEQRSVAEPASWEFCSVTIGDSDGNRWSDRPVGYSRPQGVPRASSCATGADIPPGGEAYAFGEVFQLPAESADEAFVVLTRGGSDEIRLTPR
ncbi:hypothetical protein AADG42_14955 [Ammonicoccus fulvus]|uniref:DUF4352 domain-containing protein n=1 Tax=Ammonicoccus fulvus TaxID=3138240 RepID=A0ABZ3FR36_9ACTN